MKMRQWQGVKNSSGRYDIFETVEAGCTAPLIAPDVKRGTALLILREHNRFVSEVEAALAAK